MNPEDFWQDFHAVDALASPPYDGLYPARLPDGRTLILPIRALSDGTHGLASLIINQASFAVLSGLADVLATRLRPFRPDIVIGLPTLGLTLAAAVAERLGHRRYVPLGTSRKFWYRDDLSVPLTSITTPEQRKSLFVDPRMLPLLAGARVALIDDVLSSGSSMVAGLTLCESIHCDPVVIGAAMLQTTRWRQRLADHHPDLPERVVACFETPLLCRRADGRYEPAALPP